MAKQTRPLPVQVWLNGELHSEYRSVEAAVCSVAAQTGFPYDYVWEATQRGQLEDGDQLWLIQGRG